MRLWKDENGQMIVMLAVSMTALMAFMALAVDVGMLFHVRREVQITADAAAAAGALDYHYNPTGSTARAAALTASSQNGVTNGSNGTVAVTFPASASYHSPYTTGFVQAVVTVPNPTMFMRLFRIAGVDLVSSAVAGPGASQGCVWTLGGTGTDINGSGALTATGCEIYDNSSSGRALNLTGGSISAKQVGVTGSYSGTVRPTPITGMIPVKDPLASLVAPAIPSGRGCMSAKSWTTGNHPLTPGCYDGISVSGTASLTLSAGNYTITGAFSKSGSGSLDFGSGQYIVEGNLLLSGTGSVTGTGVTFYTEGTTSLSSTGTVDLKAPTSGTYNGILIFQSSSDASAMTLDEPSGMTLEGIVYAPDAQVAVGGPGSGNVYADFVVGSLNVSGTPKLQNYASVNTATPLTKIVMVQ